MSQTPEMSFKTRFWDIESYNNFFCAVFIDEKNYLDVFYIVNSEDDRSDVERACMDSGYKYKMHDLTKDASLLIHYMDNPIPRTGEKSLLSSFLGVEDEVVEAKKDVLIAFNSINYDLPMIMYLLNSVIGNRVRTSTEALRAYSNTIINNTARRVDTRPHLRYGNHVDMAFLNETKVDKGRPTVGLKTLVGIKGGSIIESPSNKSGVSNDIHFDTLYCINDVVESRDTVFPGKMETVYNVRRKLLSLYPKLSQNGLTVNDTSAKFVEYIVSPDGPITDTPTVSFMYPAPHVAERKGVKPQDMLEYAKTWYMKNVYDVISKTNPKAAQEHLVKFMSIYGFYASVRGKNWNNSATHAMTYGIPSLTKDDRKALLTEFGTILPFINREGVESPTHAAFSLGGIHGSEINQEQLQRDREHIKRLRDKYKYISKIPAGQVTKPLLNLIIAQSRSQFQDYPQRYSHEVPFMFKQTEEVDEIIAPENFSPYQYDTSNSKMSETLLQRYKYTSSGESVHQDFDGYYPMLLINLGAFYDGHGTDNYEEVYNLRISLKEKLKTLPYGTNAWHILNIEQEGYKLVLNSASGVLDGTFDTNLRANNKAMSMRIIGQLFTWIIAQALAIESAHIPSSNTDGIYVFNIDIDKNKEIVTRELDKLYIKITPEPIYLVSKDTNNRMEMEDGKVTSARGGSLTSWEGARVDNSLSHPALVDRIMTMYLQKAHLDGPVDINAIRASLDEYHEDVTQRQFVYMASWVMRSTSGSLFVDNKNQVYPGTLRTWLSEEGTKLTRYNTRKAKRSESLNSYASQLFDDSKLGEPTTIEFLSHLGILDQHFHNATTVEEYNQGVEDIHIIGETKISKLSNTAYLHIDNRSINDLSDEEINKLYQNIDMEEYVALIAEFAATWHNKLLPVM